MINVSFDLFVYSRHRDVLETACLVPCEDSFNNIVQERDLYKGYVLSLNTHDYETQNLINKIVETLNELRLRFPPHFMRELRFMVDIRIRVTNADENSIPGITFPASFISLASDLKIDTRFQLNIDSSTRRGIMNSSSYFYVESDNEINISELNNVTGTSPSIIYRKGEMGYYTVVDYYAWGIKFALDNQPLNVFVSELMHRLQNAKKIGLYCKEHNLNPYVDITCYSISPNPLIFQLDSSFYSFLEDLSVLHLDFDFMN